MFELTRLFSPSLFLDRCGAYLGVLLSIKTVCNIEKRTIVSLLASIIANKAIKSGS